jgi:F420-dependent oxidoreductase-like protein
MKLGIGVTNFSWPVPAGEIGPIVSRIARTADDAGLDSIWTMDHFFQIRMSGLPPESPMLEAYAALAFIAGQTRRIQLGTLVTAVPNRHPGVLIKAVTSLDVLSGGRIVLGVGAGAPFNLDACTADSEAARGWEAGGLGIPYPATLAERYGRLEELLQIAHQMWRGDDQPFRGRYYQLGRPLNSPNCLQRPHPPILIGGSGERRTLRLVARYGDACNLFDIPGTFFGTEGRFSDDLPRKLRVLAGHCREAGRDYGEIEKTTATMIDLRENRRDGVRRLVGHLEELAAIGIDHALLSPQHPWDDESLEAVAVIVDEVHAIQVAASPAAR